MIDPADRITKEPEAMYYFIERMQESDIERVQEIERQSFSTLWSANTYRTEIRNQASCRYIVLRAAHSPPPPRDDAPSERRGLIARLLTDILKIREAPPPRPYPLIGYGGIWLAVEEGHITTIAVTPEYRGRGLGELLLNGLIDQAYALNAEILALEVRASNVAAQQLYLKYGFQPRYTRRRYYTDNNEDALVMLTDSIRSAEYQQSLGIQREKLFDRLRQEAERGEMQRR